MTASSKLKAKIVRVKVEADSTGLFLATSPDLKGFLVAVQNENELDAAIKTSIANLYLACGEKVVVTPAEDGSEQGYMPWVAVPTSVLAKQTA